MNRQELLSTIQEKMRSGTFVMVPEDGGYRIVQKMELEGLSVNELEVVFQALRGDNQRNGRRDERKRNPDKNPEKRNRRKQRKGKPTRRRR